jgi:hypothetical protein
MYTNFYLTKQLPIKEDELNQIEHSENSDTEVDMDYEYNSEYDINIPLDKLTLEYKYTPLRNMSKLLTNTPVSSNENSPMVVLHNRLPTIINGKYVYSQKHIKEGFAKVKNMKYNNTVDTNCNMFTTCPSTQFNDISIKK